LSAKVLQEPELEFGNDGRHQDIRFGIMNHGFLRQDSRKKQIRVGVVGTGESIDGARGWLDKCRHEIPAKKSAHPNLFPYFPGFSNDTCFETECVVPEGGVCQIPESELSTSFEKGGDLAIQELVERFAEALYQIDEKESIDVAICAVPKTILGSSDKANSGINSEPHLNFRGALKASAMKCRFPIQLLQPATYGGKGKRSIVAAKRGTYQDGGAQDEATRAWNFFVALTYKAGITPWRLMREAKDYESCFVGISFYKTLDSSRILTSMAQVFNERGEGMVLRGAPVELTKDDRTPHLTDEDARQLLGEALRKYRTEHRHLPARVALHKTSEFNQAELRGFKTALKENSVELYDFLTLGKSGIRLFRDGDYPPLRGTFLQLDEANALLYTKGSCQFYETYTGMYVPKAMRLRFSEHETPPEHLASEILALTKLNWNTSQMDGAFPITIRAAQRVGDVLKYVPESAEARPQYSYYM